MRLLSKPSRRRFLVVVPIGLLALVAVSRADQTVGGNVRITFTGSMSPSSLPRSKPAPISVTVDGQVTPLGENLPPALKSFTIALNRYARISNVGLPTCPPRLLHAKTTRGALHVCGDALVGTGHFSAHIDLPTQAPVPSVGRVLAFNAVLHGRPALVGQVYGKNPLPTTEVMPLVFGHADGRTFGTTLSAKMPDVGNEWGYVTGFDLTLGRVYRYHHQDHSFLSGSCPTPPGINLAPFNLARGIFRLADGSVRQRVLTRSCRVKREFHSAG